MSRITGTILCLAACTILALLTGCKEEGVTSQKQERLYAAQNMELKNEIARLKEQFEKDLAAKQQELDKCNEDKSVLEQEIEKETAKVFEESLTDMLVEQVEQLTQENAQLKAEIEALNKKPEQQE